MYNVCYTYTQTYRDTYVRYMYLFKTSMQLYEYPHFASVRIPDRGTEKEILPCKQTLLSRMKRGTAWEEGSGQQQAAGPGQPRARRAHLELLVGGGG